MRAMSGPGFLPQAGRLLGRDRECAAIDALLEGARADAAGALVVRGEAGIGKSALLDYARQHAPPMIVLSASGVEAESDLAFAGLHELLRPVLSYLDDLPGTQAQALAGALGLAPSSQPDRLLISAAVLGLLAAAAEAHPVLCVVDDAQWIDRPSADAMVFTARRLRAERLVILFGAREGEASRFEAADLAEITLTGLDRRSAAAILAGSAQDAAPLVRDRLLAEAAGNPLALLELAVGLPADQLDGRVPLPDAIPLTPRLEGAFRRRTGQLPAAAQTALLIAAADNTGNAVTVLRAAAGLGLPADALDPAQAAALIQVTGARIAFRHPLVRSSLYQAATLSQRQRVHAALAAALTGEEDTDRRVWHQALATLTGDEEVAAALETSARRAQLRAGHASAATAFLRAAELSTDEARRVRRIAAAAHATWDAGQPGRSREIIEQVLPLATGPTRAQLLHLIGVIQARAGSLQEACTRLLQGAEASTDPPLKLEMLMEAAEAASFSGDPDRAIELAARAAPIPATSERDKLIVALLRGFTKALAGDYEQSQALLNEALELADALDEPNALVWASYAASDSRRPGAGLTYASRAVDLARRQGLLGQLPRALARQAAEFLTMSQFDSAYAAAQEGYRLSLEVGYGHGFHLANMAAVEAVWGREQDARRHAEQALTLGQGNAYLATIAEEALGFTDLSLGRTAQAADRLLALTAPGRPDVNWLIALQAMPDAVEAGIRAGRPEEAAQRLETIRAVVAAAPTQARQALLARCEGLLGERDADEAFREAIGYAPALPPLQRARTDLLYGEWLRRERRRAEARVHLHAALAVFRGLGAVPWAERAEAELRATGETVRKRDPSAVEQLTPQELQIAGLVSQGLTNRDIAAQLYLSPRTIDYHLRKVFTKLGITSRAELIRDGLQYDSPG
jgi:DNA-binding CsgD family transcriptional regulator